MVYPQVLQVPWVSHDTVNLMVQFLPIPMPGTVCSGTGTVSENPTHGLPMQNPTCLQSVSPGQSPINTNCIIDLLHDVELPNEVEVWPWLTA